MVFSDTPNSVDRFWLFTWTFTWSFTWTFIMPSFEEICILLQSNLLNSLRASILLLLSKKYIAEIIRNTLIC